MLEQALFSRPPRTGSLGVMAAAIIVVAKAVRSVREMSFMMFDFFFLLAELTI